MQARVRLPKAFSVRDSHQFYPVQHLAERLNPRLTVVHVATGFHVHGERPVFWGLVCLRGRPLTKNEVEAALGEAGFDFQRGGTIEVPSLTPRRAGGANGQTAAEIERLPDAQIKLAILDADDVVRETALQYFTDGHSQDENVMPLVIRAVETYGRQKGLPLLQAAESLLQTPPTVEWLMHELQADGDHARSAQTPYRLALAEVLLQADVGLGPRARRKSWAWPASRRRCASRWVNAWRWPSGIGIVVGRRWNTTGWTRSSNQVTPAERRYAGRLVEAFPGTAARPAGARLLETPLPRQGPLADPLVEPEFVTMAGAMRLEAAIPLLIARAKRGNVRIIDDTLDALERIGTPAVVEAIEQTWWDAAQDLRASLAGVCRTSGWTRA